MKVGVKVKIKAKVKVKIKVNVKVKVKIGKVVKIKVKGEKIVVREWTYVLKPLEVKVIIEVPPSLILNRARLVFHQFSNSTIQVLVIEGLLLILIFLANQDVTLVKLLKELLMLGESIQKWKLS